MNIISLNNKVLVCGGDNLTSLGIIRELGEYNIPFIFIALGRCKVVTSSKYCNEIIELRNADECLRYLFDNFNDEQYKPILVISSDRLAYLFDKHQDELSKKYILPCTNRPGSLEYYTNKYNMQELASRIGINCLDSKRISKYSSIDGVEYPCFIKPCIEKPGHYNEFKYKICKSEKELKNVLKMVRPESEFMVQRCLKKDTELVVYGCRMRDGNTIISGVMYQDRFADSGFASHGFVTDEIPNYIDINKLKNFIETVGLYGPFDFEFGIENGIPYYLETNFRCVGPIGFFNKSCASVVASYIYSCAGLDYNLISSVVQQKNWCIDDMYDIENVLVGKFSYSEWKKSKKEATLLRYYDKDDMNPFFAEGKRRWKNIIKDIVVKRCRLYIVYFGDKLGLRK